MKLFNRLALACAATLAALAVAADAEKKSIEGRYELVSGEESGKKAPTERIAGSLVVIAKDTILGTDKEKKEFFAASYTLDTSSTPWKIQMVSKSPKEGMKSDGVVKVDGDRLWICYALPGGKTPTGFSTGERQNCFELKKAAK